MNLVHVPAAFIDRAWKDGASSLSEACKWAEDEITASQLKLMLSRGERDLFALEHEGRYTAWACTQVQQLPNIRTLYVYAFVAHENTGPELFRLLGDLARAQGCSSIRGACRDELIRGMQRKFGVKRLYTVFESRV